MNRMNRRSEIRGQKTESTRHYALSTRHQGVSGPWSVVRCKYKNGKKLLQRTPPIVASGVWMSEEKENCVNGKGLLRVIGRQNGFTLVEVIIVIVVVSVFMAAIGIPLLSGVRDLDVPEHAIKAYFLAQEKLEQLTVMEYDSLASQQTDCDPCMNCAQLGTGYSEFRRKVQVVEVNGSDLSTPEAGSGYTKITVWVCHEKFPDGISAETLRTDF